MKNVKFYKKGLAILGVASTLLLTGCDEKDFVSIDANKSNMIDSNVEGDTSIEPQVLDIDGENFKLVVKYSINNDENSKWRITSDKDLYIEAYTQGLPKGYKVWIDNVHIDTFIVSTSPYFNGIQQDTMDDRIHTSFLMGFPISDDVHYSSINQIAGQNDDFITGTYYGMVGDGTGTASGSIEQKRYIDEDYLEKGVYANEIGLVYGLLIQGPDDSEPYGIDVKSKVFVTVYNRVEKYDTTKNVINVYQYDMKGNKVLVNSYSYEEEAKKLQLTE